MRILFTGTSSFTGLYFLNELAKNDDFEIHAILSNSITDYEGSKKQRITLLNPKIILHPKIQFGDYSFIELLNLKFDILCCHGAFVENYNSAEFDLIKALSSNTKNISSVIKSFKNNQGKIIINTGSIFEPNEGECCGDSRAFNLYGLSKKFTNHLFKYYCQINEISFGKFVIANPFGKYEEPRFTNYLFKSWELNEIPTVQTPKYTRDNIPVDLLAKSYVDFIFEILRNAMKNKILQNYQINPSGYVDSQKAFTNRILKNIQFYYNLDYKVDFKEQVNFDQPISRYNNTNLFNKYPNWDENHFWKDYIDYYLKISF
jgi:nucleoside-diphosphate-sugar epimerase